MLRERVTSEGSGCPAALMSLDNDAVKAAFVHALRHLANARAHWAAIRRRHRRSASQHAS